MSQHDYVLENAAGAPFRADVNNALGAIATQNSGATAPTTTYAGMPWFDTTTGLQKYRNAANTAWVIDSLSEASRGSVAMNATTMDLWALPQISDGTGAAVTITAIANAPQAGARRTLYPIAGTVITNGATFSVDGAANYTTQAGDGIEFEAVTTTTYKVHITRAASSDGIGKNKIINGAMMIDQEFAGAATTFTAAAALKYAIDQWYGYCTGANVTGQRVAGTAPNKYNYRFTGAASVTKIGYAQRMEAVNTQDLAGQTATLSVDLANSLLTTVTWTAWYANTEDTFGTLAIPTRTQIATGTFTVSGALTRYNTQISIPSAAITGIEIEFSVGAQTSGTWTIGRAQLEVGGAATSFENRQYGAELSLCQRYLPAFIGGPDNRVGIGFGFDVNNTRIFVKFQKARTPPTGVTVSSPSHFTLQGGVGDAGVIGSITFSNAGIDGAAITATHSGGGGAGAGFSFKSNTAGASFIFTGCRL